MTDTELLDWLEKSDLSLIPDDAGHWAVSTAGFQNVPGDEGKPIAIAATYWVEAHEWRPTIREAIHAAFDEQNE